ncbi:hypothetical protein GCM10011613_16380 [Cellvibrio zantedeschiae]|uniref:Zinc-ribbon domain-containing protein n=1 Tax=Cellvibrio zantedeschiae TaxID=1237077 RepID=A0ABQ3B157_9GAMM|nr:putative zinc-binding peptidase [Cellvibrio zantedeschiae]GGY72147.1 hypothetical protein GCM10011613_16380 [Cellvibrio zantedeschiae]
MRLSTCGSCGQLVYFENTSCTACGALLGFSVETLKVEAFKQHKNGGLKLLNGNKSKTYRYCANGLIYNACNWVVELADDHELCVACRLNRTIPDLAVANNLFLWSKIETEKRRLIYSLLALSLPLAPSADNSPQLAFDFLMDSPCVSGESGPVLTGHANGLITLNVKEADASYREKMREQMAEPYRTLLGHFRHESGHYYWDILVRNSKWLEPVRELFGDDSLDYGSALKAYYENGPTNDWQLNYVSAYASSHPWEDWAETWAHYLHIIDTLETAREFGLQVHPQPTANQQLQVDVEINPYRTKSFRSIIEHWFPLTYALNSLNRSMGHEHAYPFVLGEPVIKKLDLIHQILQENIQLTNKVALQK